MTALAWLQDAQADDTLAGGSGADTVVGGSGQDNLIQAGVGRRPKTPIPGAPKNDRRFWTGVGHDVLDNYNWGTEWAQGLFEDDTATAIDRAQEAFEQAVPEVPTSEQWKPGFNGQDRPTWTDDNLPDGMDPLDKRMPEVTVDIGGNGRFYVFPWPPDSSAMRNNVPATIEELNAAADVAGSAAADYAIALQALEDAFKAQGTPVSLTLDDDLDPAMERRRLKRFANETGLTPPRLVYEDAVLDAAKKAGGELAARVVDLEQARSAFNGARETLEAREYTRRVEERRRRKEEQREQ